MAASDLYDPFAAPTPRDSSTEATLVCSGITLLSQQVTYVDDTQFTLLLDDGRAGGRSLALRHEREHLDQTVFLPNLQTRIIIGAQGLQADTAYFYTLDLVDQGGNTTSYDNQGIPFVVQTSKRVAGVFYNFETILGWTHSDNLNHGHLENRRAQQHVHPALADPLLGSAPAPRTSITR